jgi:hypothetical protein
MVFLTGIDFLCGPDSSAGQGTADRCPSALMGLLLCITQYIACLFRRAEHLLQEPSNILPEIAA